MIRRLFKRLLHRLLLVPIKLLLNFVPSARRNAPVRRSLWAGTPIITLAYKARAERVLSVQADSLVLHSYFLTDEFDYNLSRWMRIPLLGRFLPYGVFVWACLRYQRFHFFYDQGLLPSLQQHQFNPDELAMLNGLGKELFFWSYGADVRTQETTRALGDFNCCTDCPLPGRYCVCDEKTAALNFERIRRAATALFSMGDMIEYTPGSRNDLFFWPLDLQADKGRKFAPRYPDAVSTAPVRIIHAPNHRHFKGTRHLLEAVERIRQDGIKLDLQLVENVPNSEALEIYRSADLIFDQCLIGFHGYFAIEAMAMGKPVIAYIRKPQQYLLWPEECPLINAPADRLETVLRELIVDRARLHRLGTAGRRYVERHYTLEAFADRLQRAYKERRVTCVRNAPSSVQPGSSDQHWPASS